MARPRLRRAARGVRARAAARREAPLSPRPRLRAHFCRASGAALLPARSRALASREDVPLADAAAARLPAPVLVARARGAGRRALRALVRAAAGARARARLPFPDRERLARGR